MIHPDIGSPLVGFDMFVPGTWSRDGLIATACSRRSERASRNQRSSTLDLGAFLRRGMSTAGAALGVLFSTSIAASTPVNYLQMERQISLVCSSRYSITTSPVELRTFHIAESVIANCSNSESAVFSTNEISQTGSIGLTSAAPLNTSLDSRSRNSGLVGAVVVTDEAMRVAAISQKLSVLQDLRAYPGRNDKETILEAGPRGRSLTLFLQSDATIAMFRKAAGFDVEELAILPLPRVPEDEALTQLILTYQRHISS